MTTATLDRPTLIDTPPAEQPEDVAHFREFARFVSRDAEQNRARFYELQWQPTLWGEGALVRTWGRIGTAGQQRATIFPDRAAAQAQIARTIRARLRHGYQLEQWT